MRLPLKFYFDWDDLGLAVHWLRGHALSVQVGPLMVEWGLGE